MPKHVALYVRVSSDKQKHRSQVPDLKRWAEGQNQPVKWYRDTKTGKTMNRPGWSKLETAIRAGKVSAIVVWKQDRLGRTARELLALRDELVARKVDLIYAQGGMMGLDTPEGRMIFGVLANVAEYDNEIRSERIRAGQAAAKAAGKKWGGGKPGMRTNATKQAAVRAARAKGESISKIARDLELSRPTVYAILRDAA